MRAATTGANAISICEHPDPRPGEGQLLVRVRAAALNTVDLTQRRGGFSVPPDSPADIPGLEFAGDVLAIGPGVLRFRPGARVMALVSGGAQAELVLVHERLAVPIPEQVSWVTAGAFPESFATAYDALFTQCGLMVGERLLVHGAAGGVGTAAVQLAAAAGARVTATVRNPKVREEVMRLGATVIAPLNFADHGPFDVILELVGGPNMAENLSALELGGRISVIGLGGGSEAKLDLRLLMAKSGRILVSALRTRPLEQKASVVRGVEAHVLPLLMAGRLQVPITATFPLAEVEAAYDRFSAGSKFGKIVLTMET